MHHCGTLPDGTEATVPNAPAGTAYTAQFAAGDSTCAGRPLVHNHPRTTCDAECHSPPCAGGAGDNKDESASWVHIKAHEKTGLKQAFWSSNLITETLTGKEIFRNGNPFHLTAVPQQFEHGVLLRIPQQTKMNTEFRIDLQKTASIYVLFEEHTALDQWKTMLVEKGFAPMTETASFSRETAHTTAGTMIWDADMVSEVHPVLCRVGSGSAVQFTVSTTSMDYQAGQAHCASTGGALAAIYNDQELATARAAISAANVDKAITAAISDSQQPIGWTWHGTERWTATGFPMNTGQVTDCPSGHTCPGHTFSLWRYPDTANSGQNTANNAAAGAMTVYHKEVSKGIRTVLPRTTAEEATITFVVKKSNKCLKTCTAAPTDCAHALTYFTAPSQCAADQPQCGCAHSCSVLARAEAMAKMGCCPDGTLLASNPNCT